MLTGVAIMTDADISTSLRYDGRLALRRPLLIHSVIAHNAPISIEGLGPFWEETGLRSLWEDPTPGKYKDLQAKLFTYDAVKLQACRPLTGSSAAEQAIDHFLIARVAVHARRGGRRRRSNPARVLLP